MTQQPFNPAALRGAVDLSGLGGRTGPQAPAAGPGAGAAGPSAAGAAGAGAAGAGPAAGSGVPGQRGALIQAGDAEFESVVNASLRVPMVLVLWTPQVPESGQHLQELAAAAVAAEGRFQVVGVDLTANPGIMQALTPLMQQAFGQVSALPVVIGLLAGQPMPFYLGVQPMTQVDQLLEKFLEAAVTNGISTRVTLDDQDAALAARGAAGMQPGADGADGEAAEPDLPPLHQEAYEAIDRGDWAAAIDAYDRALDEDPADELARLGRGQVQLLQRAGELDPAVVRQRAAEAPDDAQAQIDAADLDMVGGHVEDAFARLVDTVRRTAGEDRDRVRTHLLSLFEVIGAQDPRVLKGRQALMSALF